MSACPDTLSHLQLVGKDGGDVEKFGVSVVSVEICFLLHTRLA